jgi:hypothetical protein
MLTCVEGGVWEVGSCVVLFRSFFEGVRGFAISQIGVPYRYAFQILFSQSGVRTIHGI